MRPGAGRVESDGFLAESLGALQGGFGIRGPSLHDGVELDSAEPDIGRGIAGIESHRALKECTRLRIG